MKAIKHVNIFESNCVVQGNSSKKLVKINSQTFGNKTVERTTLNHSALDFLFTARRRAALSRADRTPVEMFP